ncbi:putative bifunctional diguanylate cyclase/phosphodiesterase [Kaarinaea lacus]
MSLKYRIAAVIFILEAVMMGVVFTVTLTRSDQINLQQLAVNEGIITSLLGDLSRTALFAGDYDELQPYIEKIVQDSSIVKVVVVDRNSRVGACSDASDIGKMLPPLISEGDTYWRAYTIKNSAQILGTVAINFSHSQFKRARQEVVELGIQIALIGMTLIAVIGFITGYLLTRRLAVLSYAAQRLADGEYGVQTGLQGGDELALVGRAFDNMARSIENSVASLHAREQELQRTQDELEMRVHERTKDLASANKKLTFLALHDPLTGLANRSLLVDRLEQGILRSQRENGSLAIFVMDLDHFKEINDTLGHNIGDQLLMEVAHRLENALRNTDTIARLGGDEFAIILQGDDLEQASIVASNLLKTLDRPFFVENNKLSISGSLGIAMCPEDGEDSSILLQKADVAMYVAKRNNLGFSSYDPQFDIHHPGRLTIVSDLRHAIERNELKLFYQPKVDIKTGCLIGVEALLRWQRNGQYIPPDQFIPVAEKTGLIKPLTLWVLDVALQHCAKWQKAGYNLTTAVNLSTHNLKDAILDERIKELLTRWEVAPNSIILEITETDMMANPEEALELSKRLHAMGIGLSIDDFGTGYSSLVYLKKLPVEEVKIDRSFIVDSKGDKDSAVIVQSIIDLAHNLELKVVAEGVEDKHTINQLASLGCDYAQGYYISPPLDTLEFDRWLTRFYQGNGKCRERLRLISG